MGPERVPLVYRAMKRDVDGLPIVGANSKELGVRVPPNAHADVDVKPDGTVELNGKGMSVAKHWTLLRPHLIPKRLKSVVPPATGSNILACFRIGEGEFMRGSINHELTLALKPGQDSLGNIVPAAAMTLMEFQQALASTHDQWSIDEASP
jgi:hypothetical protein